MRIKQLMYFLMLGSAMVAASACSRTGETANEPTPLEENTTIDRDLLVMPSEYYVYTEYNAENLPEIAYEKVEVKDLLEIHNQDGKGIEVDLNGDEVPEQIYAYQEGLLINGVLYKGMIKSNSVYDEDEMYRTWWLMDVVKGDGKLEMVFLDPASENAYSMYHYDETLIMIGNTTKYDEIQNSINDPIFVDESKILVTVCTFLLDGTYLDAYCTLDKNGIFVIVPDEYEMESSLQVIKDLKLYSEKQQDASYVIVEPQEVKLTKTDGANWIYIVAEDGKEGWIHIEHVKDGTIVNKEGNRKEFFEGFSTAG